LYSSPHIIIMVGSSKMRWAENLAHTREKRNAYRIWVRKPERTRPFRRPRRRWEDIKTDLREIGWGNRRNRHWIHLAQNRDQWHLL
jgi:hypothetical protein